MIQKCTLRAAALILMLFISASAFAQINLDIELSNPAPEAGQPFSITFTASEASALFYYGLEVSYDESRFSFTGVSAGELMGVNPLQIADVIAPATIGASVARTSGSGDGAGSVITLDFMTLPGASAGEAIFTISNADLRNTAGAQIDVIVDETISVTVPASETFTVYYNNPGSWANVNAYAFESDGGEYLPWPGEAMTLPEEGSIWYSYDIPVNFNRVIFNDGAENQTDNLIRNSDGWFDGTQWYDSEPNLDESRLVIFSVDMGVQAELGNFDITLNDLVYV
ncbi:MAG: starch-binding protein, partial [Balneolia bacterium]|nr:starch-binding protein [Balneolia bacterium]